MGHSPMRVVIVTATLLCNITVGVLAYLFGHMPQQGPFISTASTVLENYIVPITPPCWIFYAWWPINALQVTWLIYAMTTTCRKSGDGTPLYMLNIVTPVVYGMYIVNDLLVIAWMFSWDQKMTILSFIIAMFLPCCLYSALVSSTQTLYKKRSYMNKNDVTKDIAIIQLLVQNGIGCYATWVTMGMLLNFTIVMAYDCGIETNIASVVSLIIMFVQSVGWLLMDVTIFDKQVRYVISPYVTCVFVVAGMAAKNVDLENMTAVSLVTVCLLVCVSLQLVMKVTLTVWRHNKHPLRSRNSYDLNTQQINGVQ